MSAFDQRALGQGTGKSCRIIRLISVNTYQRSLCLRGGKREKSIVIIAITIITRKAKDCTLQSRKCITFIFRLSSVSLLKPACLWPQAVDLSFGPTVTSALYFENTIVAALGYYPQHNTTTSSSSDQWPYFQGRIDNVAIYDKPLKVETQLEHFNLGKSRAGKHRLKSMRCDAMTI